MDRPQNWLKMIGWKAFWLKKFERNRCGESFLTPTVTLGHVFKKKKNHKTLLLLRFVADSFKANNEHLQKKKKWTFILKSLRGH